MRILAAGALAFAFVPGLWAGYSNLMATADGNTVYFQASGLLGLAAERWYTLRNTSAGQSLEVLNASPVDVSASGAVVAFASYGERQCGIAGSTCFLQPACSASYAVRGPGFEISESQRRTFLRLDRAGRYAW